MPKTTITIIDDNISIYDECLEIGGATSDSSPSLFEIWYSEEEILKAMDSDWVNEVSKSQIKENLRLMEKNKIPLWDKMVKEGQCCDVFDEANVKDALKEYRTWVFENTNCSAINERPIAKKIFGENLL